MKAINEISSKFYRWTSIKAILILIVTIILYFIISTIFSDQSLEGKKILELSFYTPSEAYSIIESYGIEGRTSYQTHLAFDVLFAVLYSVLLTLLLSKLYIVIQGESNAEKLQNNWHLLPFVVGFLDGLENLCLSLLIFVETVIPISRLSVGVI